MNFAVGYQHVSEGEAFSSLVLRCPSVREVYFPWVDEPSGRPKVGYGEEDDAATVVGRPAPLRGGSFRAFGDHRIAMSVAVGATVADGLVEVDDVACAAKSYPRFFTLLERT